MQRQHARNLFSKTCTFDYNSPYVVPNADLQIIRANAPHQPIPIRPSDLLPDKTNPIDVSLDGDWVNLGIIRMDTFKQNLRDESLYLEGETIWPSSFSLNSLDLTPMITAFLRDDEKRLVGMNLASAILQTIHEF